MRRKVARGNNGAPRKVGPGNDRIRPGNGGMPRKVRPGDGGVRREVGRGDGVRGGMRRGQGCAVFRMLHDDHRATRARED